MTITVVASCFVKTGHSFTEVLPSTVSSDNQSTLSTCPYTYGTGVFQIDAAVKSTGVLPSGGSVILNMQALNQTVFGVERVVSLTGVKNICISNGSTTQGMDIAVRATGTNAFTTPFNGGSGNVLIKPYSSFVYNDPYSMATSPTSKEITLYDVSGSGAYYSVSIMGNLV